MNKLAGKVVTKVLETEPKLSYLYTWSNLSAVKGFSYKSLLCIRPFLKLCNDEDLSNLSETNDVTKPSGR